MAPVPARCRVVHPRVGGERRAPMGAGRAWCGSSPRGRGTPFPEDRGELCGRFIPAWAGNARPVAAPPTKRPVHPRVGGERLLGRIEPDDKRGSSPRGRGTRGCGRQADLGARFIPAWAGNAHPNETTERSQAVHPRVGGERVISAVAGPAQVGSSPRGRGTHGEQCPESRGRRFIPAWAGNAEYPGPFGVAAAVHPRVGGERLDDPTAG